VNSKESESPLSNVTFNGLVDEKGKNIEDQELNISSLVKPRFNSQTFQWFTHRILILKW